MTDTAPTAAPTNNSAYTPSSGGRHPPRASRPRKGPRRLPGTDNPWSFSLHESVNVDQGRPVSSRGERVGPVCSRGMAKGRCLERGPAVVPRSQLPPDSRR